METNTIHLLLLALLGSVIALAGGVVFLYKDSWSKLIERHSIPFAAGVLITVSLIALIPEAFELIGEHSLVVVLITFFAAFLFEHVLFHIHHHDDHHGHGKHFVTSIPLVIVGDTIHNFIDGVAIGASFLVSPGLGLVTALSTFLHEVPHEIGDFGILLKAGWKKKKILLVNLFSALFTIPGAFLLLYFVGNDVIVGNLLAIAAGIFLYLGTVDFLPNISDGYSNKVKSTIPLLIGVLLMWATLSAIPHSHENEEVHEEDEIHLEELQFTKEVDQIE